MKVAFDVTTLAFKQRTGTGVYVEEFLKSYEKCFLDHDEVTHTYRLTRRIKGRQYLRPLARGVKRATLIDPITSFRGLNYDIFHGLNARLPVLTHAKLIVTVHDLISLYGDFSKPEFLADQTAKLKKMVQRANTIIVPSTFTKTQFENRLEVNPAKLKLIPLGVRDLFLDLRITKEESRHAVRERFGLKDSFIFFAGALEKRKNVKGLVEAYTLLMKEYKKPLDLVLGGHPGFEYEAIEEAIQDSEARERIKILGFVSETELSHLYRACDLFAFPSFEEGYGLPVLEAMACGAPVLSGNITSLPEVGNGHSWLVNPRSLEEIVSTMKIILKNEPQTVERAKAGQLYARTCTWDKVAKSTREVYKQVLSNP